MIVQKNGKYCSIVDRILSKDFIKVSEAMVMLPSLNFCATTFKSAHGNEIKFGHFEQTMTNMYVVCKLNWYNSWSETDFGQFAGTSVFSCE